MKTKSFTEKEINIGVLVLIIGGGRLVQVINLLRYILS